MIIIILAAYAAHSAAIAGFGLDSLIKIFASVVVVWQLTRIHLKRKRLALRLIGIAFIALVIYIVAQLLYTLATSTHAAISVGGIAWTAAIFIAMLLLAFGKQVTGRQLQNEVLLTEGRVSGDRPNRKTGNCTRCCVLSFRFRQDHGVPGTL